MHLRSASWTANGAKCWVLGPFEGAPNTCRHRATTTKLDTFKLCTLCIFCVHALGDHAKVVRDAVQVALGEAGHTEWLDIDELGFTFKD